MTVELRREARDDRRPLHPAHQELHRRHGHGQRQRPGQVGPVDTRGSAQGRRAGARARTAADRRAARRDLLGASCSRAPRAPRPTPTSPRRAPPPPSCATSSTGSTPRPRRPPRTTATANDALEQTVSQLLVADEDVDARAGPAPTGGRGRTADAARHMYMTGGPGSLYASVLAGESISDVLDRHRLGRLGRARRHRRLRRRARAGGRGREGDARQTSRCSPPASTRLEDAARRGRHPGRDAAAPGARAAYDSADALVRDLVERERAMAQARAEAAARAAATAVDPNWTTEPVPADRAPRSTAPSPRRRPPRRRRTPSAPSPTPAAGWGRRTPPAAAARTALAPAGARAARRTTAAPTTAPAAPTSTVGFDCSSLMVRIFSQGGLNLPRTSRQQWYVGPHVTHEGAAARRPAVLGVRHRQPRVDPPRGDLPRPRPDGPLAAHRRPRARGAGLPQRLLSARSARADRAPPSGATRSARGACRAAIVQVGHVPWST